jgi:hypothetical protein
MRRDITEEEQWVKVNIDRKRSPCIKKDCFGGKKTTEILQHR